VPPVQRAIDVRLSLLLAWKPSSRILADRFQSLLKCLIRCQVRSIWSN
jgi:hypothetical protein